MARYAVVVLSIFMMAATVALAEACSTQGGGTQQQVGKMQRESKSVDPKNAQSARAQLKMGTPDLGVSTSCFESLSYASGPLGRQEPVHRLQRRVRQL